MSATPLIVCPVCNKTGLKRLQPHLTNVHKLTGEERKEMLKKAKYTLPAAAAAETSSSATNTDFVKEESYPCTSEKCGKDSYLQEWLKKCEVVLDQDTEKCQTKGKINEQVYALKEVNKALRRFTNTVHSGEAPYTRCNDCNEFKKHVNCRLQGITL